VTFARDGVSMFATRACVAVVCIGCGEHYGPDFECHFETLADALREVLREGWTVTEDTVLCIVCGEDNPPPELPLVVCEYCAPPLFFDAPSADRCRCRGGGVRVPFVSRRHPGFEQHSCVTIRCPECAQPINGDDDREPHYSSQAKGLAAARERGWIVTDRIVCCRRCAQRRGCVALGHSWPEFPDHVTGEGVELRWCRQCDEFVMSLAANPGMPWL
jgi:hypothetical protein